MSKHKLIGGAVACGLSLCSFGYTAADFAPERPDGSTMRSLAGATDRLKVRRYPKYADDAARPHTNADLRQTCGLTDADFLAWSNCDPSQHSFHPEAVLPWLCRAFGMSTHFDDALRAELRLRVFCRLRTR